MFFKDWKEENPLFHKILLKHHQSNSRYACLAYRRQAGLYKLLKMYLYFSNIYPPRDSSEKDVSFSSKLQNIFSTLKSITNFSTRAIHFTKLYLSILPPTVLHSMRKTT